MAQKSCSMKPKSHKKKKLSEEDRNPYLVMLPRLRMIALIQTMDAVNEGSEKKSNKDDKVL